MQRSRKILSICRKFNLKGLGSRICRELWKHNNKKVNIQWKIRAKGTLKKETQIARKHMLNERCSMLLVIAAQTIKLFSKVVAPFYILTSMVRVPVAQHPCQLLVSLFNFSHAHGCVVVSYWFFFLYKINMCFNHKCIAVNTTIWCDCPYY